MTNTGSKTLYLDRFNTQNVSDKCFPPVSGNSPKVSMKTWYFLRPILYLSFCKHTDVGRRLRGKIIFTICEDGAIKKSQIITSWVVQLHLAENKTEMSSVEKTAAPTMSQASSPDISYQHY